MNIAIFGKSFSPENEAPVRNLIEKLDKCSAGLVVYEPYYSRIRHLLQSKNEIKVFANHDDIRQKVDFLFSIGGDGTLLDTITLVRDSGIPIMGINLGRMGFLSSISKDRIDHAIEQLVNKKFRLDHRTLLRLNSSNDIFDGLNYALNEFTVYKKEPLPMLKIQTFVNDDYLNAYWADGLIIATPTGSTAYSLSAGGPIVMPQSNNFVITPIATHNLTVRPIVIPDNNTIRVKVVGRIKDFFVSLDSRTKQIDSSVELTVQKEDFKISLVQLEDESYFKTIREKLMWGLDIRN
jgi:NAD+ kinase